MSLLVESVRGVGFLLLFGLVAFDAFLDTVYEGRRRVRISILGEVRRES